MKFELVVEVRPRVASGVLLHAYTTEKEYLTVYIHNNQVMSECLLLVHCIHMAVVIQPTLLRKDFPCIFQGCGLGEQRHPRVLHCCDSSVGNV